jgi:hypothetical protein
MRCLSFRIVAGFPSQIAVTFVKARPIDDKASFSRFPDFFGIPTSSVGVAVGRFVVLFDL